MMAQRRRVHLKNGRLMLHVELGDEIDDEPVTIEELSETTPQLCEPARQLLASTATTSKKGS